MSEITVSNFTIEVLHKYDEDSLIVLYDFYFTGTVEQNTLPVIKQVYAYNTTTNKLVGRSSSNATGSFLLPVTTSGSCYVVCLNDSSTYNHLIAKQINPLIRV